MSKAIKITPGRGLIIRYSGVFDFDKLYKEMHDWFMKNSYGFEEKQHDDRAKDRGRDIEIVWNGERKVDEFVKFLINVRFVIEEFNKVEKLDSGKLLIEISASAILDYTDRWNRKPFSNFLFNVYTKYIIKEKINNYYLGKLYRETVNLQELGKSVLELYS